MVREWPAAELQRLDAGSWFHPSFADDRLLSLDETLDIVGGRVSLVIELKGSDRLPLLVAQAVAASERHPGQQATFSSFNTAALAEARRMAPAIPRAWLFSLQKHTLADALRIGSELQLQELCPRAADVDLATAAALHEAGFAVRAWGLPKGGDIGQMIAAMRSLLAAGTDGTTAEFPDMMRSVVLAMGGREQQV